MTQRSPTLEGFRTILRRPSFGLAEISWRWTFGLAAISLLVFSAVEYLNTLPVGRGDLFLLRTRHPLLVSRGLAHIFEGSALRSGKAGLLLIFLLALAWVVVASWSRSLTVRELLNYFGEVEGFACSPANGREYEFNLSSLFALNALRVVITVAAVFACVAAFILGDAASPTTNPSPGCATLVFCSLVLGISMVWLLLNWFLSLAGVIAVAKGSRALESVTMAVDLCRNRWGSFIGAATGFGIAHLIMFFIAGSLLMLPLALATVLPPAVVFGGVVLVALLYFAAVDFLYAGRMSAYVAMILQPISAVQDTKSTGGIDRDELILSDFRILPATS